MSIAAARIRPAALAGAFYPDDPARLARAVDDHLAAAPRFRVAPKALIAPHAGYDFSGPIAGTAFAALAPFRKQYRRVVVLSPPHRVAVPGFAVPTAQAFATPLGPVPLDPAGIATALRHPLTEQRDDTHDQEHGIEVLLPFLQRSLAEFSLVPVVVGDVAPREVARLIGALWGGPETLIIVSSDLSHFLSAEQARDLDTAAVRSIEKLATAELRKRQACGHAGVRGLLEVAKALDLRATALDLRNSADTGGRGNPERVVGYAAIAFEPAEGARLSDEHRRALLTVGAKALDISLKHNRPAETQPESFARPLQAMRACFVTLKQNGDLRGCTGSVVPHQPLVADMAANTYRTAFGDPRFKPLTRAEVNELDLSVSILSTPRRLTFGSEEEARRLLRPGIDGLILQEGGHRGLFLPQVWEDLKSPKAFLNHLKRKAGLPLDHWSEDVQLYRYTVEGFGTRLRAE